MFTNKKKIIKGNYHKPMEFLLKQRHVFETGIIKPFSAIGNGGGYFQEEKDHANYYLIFFSQENNQPKESFTLTTTDVIASKDSVFTLDEIWRHYNEYVHQVRH